MPFLNLSHPLTDEHPAQVKALACRAIGRVVVADSQIDARQPLALEASSVADALR